MLWNLFLMLTWAALTNDFSLTNLIIGFILGYATIASLTARGVIGSARYTRRTTRSVAFFGFYLKELVMANLRMAKDVLNPKMTMRPAIVAIKLDPRTESDAEITLLANLISLTPGTLSMEISPDRRVLYVHTMDLPNGDIEAFRQSIKKDMERRVLEVLR